MNRREFTKNITMLVSEMIADGHEPIYDYMLRSKEEQGRLYAAGLSKCDGVDKMSDHQYAKAVDIYFVVKNSDGSIFVDFNYTKTLDLAIKYHKRWEELGGKPIIKDTEGKIWDPGHYGTR